jgi:hypothetical protein
MRQYIVLSNLAVKPTMQRISTRSLERTTAALWHRIEA